jgi:hypothetical protein
MIFITVPVHFFESLGDRVVALAFCPKKVTRSKRGVNVKIMILANDKRVLSSAAQRGCSLRVEGRKTLPGKQSHLGVDRHLGLTLFEHDFS